MDYIQLHYHDNPTDFINEKLTIGAGFRIPIPNSNQRLKENLQLKQLNSRLEYETDKFKTSKSIRAIIYTIDNLTEQYNLISTNYNYIQTKYNSVSLAASERTSPFFILDIQYQLGKLKFELSEIRNSILDQYIKYLTESGTMYRNPELYYLEFPFSPL